MPALLSGELAESLDPLTVGAELLSIFDTLGRSGQLTLVLVDDLHWSDSLSARALLFCLRRLLADRVLVGGDGTAGATCLPWGGLVPLLRG